MKHINIETWYKATAGGTTQITISAHHTHLFAQPRDLKSHEQAALLLEAVNLELKKWPSQYHVTSLYVYVEKCDGRSTLRLHKIRNADQEQSDDATNGVT